MPAMNVKHFQGVVRADRILQRIFFESFFVSTQCPLNVSEMSDPEPDVAVIEGKSVILIRRSKCWRRTKQSRLSSSLKWKLKSPNCCRNRRKI
jgi:hypothetical protein